MSCDYRDSHKHVGKGESYHSQFSKNPYRALIWEMERSVLDVILRKYLSRTRLRHLDFACGTGRIVEHFKDVATTSVGIDVSESMLKVARERLAGCEIINADLTRSDILGERRFELVTAFRFFPNAQADLRRCALERCVAHMSVAGYLVFNNHKNYTSTVFALGRLLGRKDLHEMKSTEVASLVEAAGLEIVETYHIGVIPATDRYRLAPIWLLRPIERVLSKFRIFSRLAFNTIYVCRRKDQGRTK